MSSGILVASQQGVDLVVSQHRRRHQQPEAGARDYGRGFWSQQWLGLKRLAGRDRGPVREPSGPAAAERA